MDPNQSISDIASSDHPNEMESETFKQTLITSALDSLDLNSPSTSKYSAPTCNDEFGKKLGNEQIFVFGSEEKKKQSEKKFNFSFVRSIDGEKSIVVANLNHQKSPNFEFNFSQINKNTVTTQSVQKEVVQKKSCPIPKNSIKFSLNTEVTNLLETIAKLELPKEKEDPSIDIQQTKEKICFDAEFVQKLKKKPYLDWQLKRDFLDLQKHYGYHKIQSETSKLPTNLMKYEILNVLYFNQVMVLSGETGCGKTTQLAQIILDDAILNDQGSTTKILCTQPRRISAISVAERVAYERLEDVGRSVGYQIRLEKNLCRRHGSILFCTSGILMQFMQGDESLAGFSHIILDEVHERSIDTDVIMKLLKNLLVYRPDIKVVLMSATLNADQFCQYFGYCPKIHIPGKMYPIEDFYLEDILSITNQKIEPEQFNTLNKSRMQQAMAEKRKESKEYKKFIDPYLKQLRSEGHYSTTVITELEKLESEKLNLKLIIKLIEHICLSKPPGAILVFVPGLKEIKELIFGLKKNSLIMDSTHCEFYPLHSKLSTWKQKMIFQPAPRGVRKIIVSTSIAETSITIDDVVYVIDSGKSRFVRFDIEKKIDCLVTEWISKANEKQRRGRAGRVQPGECYKMFTKARENAFDEVITPEILRIKLESIIMQIKMLNFDPVKEFLSSLLDSPSEKAIDVSIDTLKTIQVLDKNEKLTKLGYQLAHMPLDPLTGKMILWGAVLSCCDPILSIAATLSYQDAYQNDMNNEKDLKKIKEEMSKGEFSDHIGYAECLRLFEEAFEQKKAHEFCNDNHLAFNTMTMLVKMKRQFANYLYHLKLLVSNVPSDPRMNINSENLELIKAIVCAGLYPNIAVVKFDGNKFPTLRTHQNEVAKFHPSSVNFGKKQLPTNYITYFFKQKSSQIFLHDTSCVSQAAVIFAAANSFTEYENYALCTINHQISFWCNSSTGKLIRDVRAIFDQLLDLQIMDPNSPQWQLRNDYIKLSIQFLTQQDDSNDSDSSEESESSDSEWYDTSYELEDSTCECSDCEDESEDSENSDEIDESESDESNEIDESESDESNEIDESESDESNEIDESESDESNVIDEFESDESNETDESESDESGSDVLNELEESDDLFE